MGIILKQDERGFSLVESSIVFVVIVLLAAAAGIVADRQNANPSQQLRPNVIQLGTQPSTHPSSPTATTLELSALGIDITVPNAISDLTYAAPGANGGYGISTKTLTTQDANCVATGSAPPLGYFFKGTGKYAESGSRRLARQFGNFYVAWDGPQSPCSSSATVTALASQQLQNLVDSFSTIEEIPPNSGQ